MNRSPRIADTRSIYAKLTDWLQGTSGRKGRRSFRLRVAVQTAFALTCVVMGIQVTSFYRAAQIGSTPLPARPPGVEGFLPISGLMGVLDWVYQGTLNRIHPAATVVFLIVVAIALLFRKSFCSWICPVGFMSDTLAKLGRRIFGRNFRPWRWLDVTLQGFKYLILAFFGWAVFTMGADALQGFIESPYNKVADVKMGLFFIRLSQFGVTVMIVLTFLSVLIQGFWCRYLCPYGALLGFFSGLSPVKIRREPTSCTDCGQCDRACPSRLPVSSKLSISSVECTGCLDCVASCPEQDVLGIHAGRRRLSLPAYAAAILLLFLAGYTTARATGHWDNDIGDTEYVERLQKIDDPEYGHPGSE